MEKIKFKDVAHLYVGCKMKSSWDEHPQEETLIGTFGPGKLIYKYDQDMSDIIESSDLNHPENHDKPILRKISSMTRSEAIWIYSNFTLNEPKYTRRFPVNLVLKMMQNSRVFLWLLGRRFDLFNLIENGEAIDVATHPKT
jgi:hypothetical protein